MCREKITFAFEQGRVLCTFSVQRRGLDEQLSEAAREQMTGTLIYSARRKRNSFNLPLHSQLHYIEVFFMTGTLSCSIFQNVTLIIKKYKCTRRWKMVKISQSMRREREAQGSDKENE